MITEDSNAGKQNFRLHVNFRGKGTHLHKYA